MSGIGDIEDLAEKFDGSERYKVVMIHSDIPFEDQAAAFAPIDPTTIKACFPFIYSSSNESIYRSFWPPMLRRARLPFPMLIV